MFGFVGNVIAGVLTFYFVTIKFEYDWRINVFNTTSDWLIIVQQKTYQSIADDSLPASLSFNGM